jgi:ankyrin repeat protein
MPGPTVRHSLAAIATLGLALAVWLAWPGTNTLVGQAARGDVAGARWSLRLGVDPDIPTRWGWSRENEGQTPLTVAAQFGRIEIVRLLLAEGADPDLRDFGGQGDTALSTAAWHGQLEVCRVLLDAGADPNIRTHPAAQGNTGNRTALDWALRANHPEAAELLRQYGAIESGRGGH